MSEINNYELICSKYNRITHNEHTTTHNGHITSMSIMNSSTKFFEDAVLTYDSCFKNYQNTIRISFYQLYSKCLL